MYPNAMSGTRMLLILAMRCIPPKMMIRVSSVIAEPMYNGRIWKALSNAAQIVLLCTELKAKPNGDQYCEQNSHPPLLQAGFHIVSRTSDVRVTALSFEELGQCGFDESTA